MRLSGALLAASLLVSARAQDSSILSADTSISSSSTSSAPEVEITAGPEVCAGANFDNCYNIISILTPTVYVILTVTDAADAPGADPITSGDPILTESQNIATATDEAVEPPTTAIVDIIYFSSTGTTCFPSTGVTSTLTNSADHPCLQATGGPVNTAPAEVTKTRVFIKAREDDTQGKGTDGGNGATTTPGNTDTAQNVETTSPPGNTENIPTQAPTTDGSPQPTGTIPTSAETTTQATEVSTGTIPTTIAGDAATGSTTTIPVDLNSSISSTSSVSASEAMTMTPSDSISSSADTSIPSSTGSSSPPTDSSSAPTDSNNTSMDSVTTPSSSGQQSSKGTSTDAGQNETGKPEVTTSFTTIAEVSNGSTKFVTSAVATMTRSQPSVTTTGSGSGAGSNHMFNAEIFLGAVGMAAMFGL
ncbi:hypothetical protein H072_1213 [Dactylellina haptotyla CBS 200.50]|uniref:Uncharacterized protein n=1 Tax=Dactylellina haptotyla (strain CBS 200.50) TaxID=1284197 RepID=S8BZ73_DACHA|nr:hypothetical protein H072_1213 [Dactylellina haptotyla CBS 200.50]